MEKLNQADDYYVLYKLYIFILYIAIAIYKLYSVTLKLCSFYI